MPTSVRLDPIDEARLTRLAVLTHRTKAFYLRELILAGLTRMEKKYFGEDVADSALMKKSLEDFFPHMRYPVRRIQSSTE